MLVMNFLMIVYKSKNKKKFAEGIQIEKFDLFSSTAINILKDELINPESSKGK